METQLIPLKIILYLFHYREDISSAKFQIFSILLLVHRHHSPNHSKKTRLQVRTGENKTQELWYCRENRSRVVISI